MVQWVYEMCIRSELSNTVVVATPDDEILDACKQFGAEGIRTRNDHPSGTDRIAEVAQTLKADVYINVQGDEPLLPIENVSAVSIPFDSHPGLQMASVWCPCGHDEAENPAVVKVVTDLEGFALYFSRHNIPFERNEHVDKVKRHLGIYAFTGEALERFSKWEPSPLERTESLEQLRFLEHGERIYMAEGKAAPTGIDTPEQAEQVRALLERQISG